MSEGEKKVKKEDDHRLGQSFSVCVRDGWMGGLMSPQFCCIGGLGIVCMYMYVFVCMCVLYDRESKQATAISSRERKKRT